MNRGKPLNSLAGKKIVVGAREIASFTSRIAIALSRAEADVLYFNAQEHPLNPPVEETNRLRRLLKRGTVGAMHLRAKGLVFRPAAWALIGLCKLLAFATACLWADTCVFVGGKGIFGTSLEYAFLRLLGKRVVHVQVGTASRPRYLSGFAKEALAAGHVDAKSIRALARRTRRQATRIRTTSRWASVVVENPLCGHFYEKPFVNFFKLGVPLDVATLAAKPRLKEFTPARTDGIIRILHCTSRPALKGTYRIQAAIGQLIQEGLPLEFRWVQGIPHAQVLQELALCDFAVDQLYSDSPMAGFASEASALGKAAIVGGYGWTLLRQLLSPQEMPPTALCHPDELKETIRLLALDPVRRDGIGAKSRAFLEDEWSEACFAERFARIVKGDIPPDWLVRPEQVRYLHGLGLEEDEARRIIGGLVERFGADSLQVSHIPELRDQLVAFAKGAPVLY